MKNGSWWISLLLLLCSAAHAGTRHYYYTDPQGTVLAKADAQGNIVATYDYAPYGSQALGSPPNGPGYTGHVNDPDTGFVYMQARYYDPTTGRFLSVDPVTPKSGNIFNFNRFIYANDNPIVNIDPDGRQAFTGWSEAQIHATRDNPAAAAQFNDIATDFMPVAGDIKGVVEAIYEPTPANIIGAVVGFLPIAGDVAGKFIKNADRVADIASTSRAARREAMRQEGIPTSRPATSQSGTEGGRQQIVEGADGKPQVVSQHSADATHPNPHWHAASPKVDDAGNLRTNSHGQVKYRSDGSVAEYAENP